LRVVRDGFEDAQEFGNDLVAPGESFGYSGPGEVAVVPFHLSKDVEDIHRVARFGPTASLPNSS
jgi:hypothetical protein